MLDPKVARDCEQSVHGVHDLSQSTFGLESYVERVEPLMTSAGSDVAPKFWGVWTMGEVGKTLQIVYGSRKVNSHFHGAKCI
jgi:hypothetical protein